LASDWRAFLVLSALFGGKANHTCEHTEQRTVRPSSPIDWLSTRKMVSQFGQVKSITESPELRLS
jgi:hypothetical protein